MLLKTKKRTGSGEIGMGCCLLIVLIVIVSIIILPSPKSTITGDVEIVYYGDDGCFVKFKDGRKKVFKGTFSRPIPEGKSITIEFNQDRILGVKEINQ